MEKRKYTVAIDLGTSNVVVAIGTVNAEDKMEVIAIVSTPVKGVEKGKIENIELAAKSIDEALQKIQDKTGVRIIEAYVGLSGEFVRCAQHTDHVYTNDPVNGISQRDLDSLVERMRNVQAPDQEVIMECSAQVYMVDDTHEVKNPVGAFGRKLSATFNFILCNKTYLQRLESALKRFAIRVVGVYPNALVVADTLLTDDEREEGVAVVDVGGGTTDVSVYYGGVLRHLASAPIGGGAISRDIRSMSIMEKYVADLKHSYGCAVAELVPENKLVRVPGRTSKESKDIYLRNLATVIEGRASDIVEFAIQRELSESKIVNRLAYGVVLTGGEAKLKGFDRLVEKKTGFDVRVGRPDEHVADVSLELVSDPAYSTVLGLLWRGVCNGGCSLVVSKPESVETNAEREERENKALEEARELQRLKDIEDEKLRQAEADRQAKIKAENEARERMLADLANAEQNKEDAPEVEKVVPPVVVAEKPVETEPDNHNNGERKVEDQPIEKEAAKKPRWNFKSLIMKAGEVLVSPSQDDRDEEI